MSTAPTKKASSDAVAKPKDTSAKTTKPATEAKPAKTPAETKKTRVPTRSGAAKVTKARSARSKVATRARHAEGRLAQVLIAPIVSEKATLVSEKRNQVMFKVLRDATKPEIKAAVELLFKVEVASVQTLVQKGKVKKFGRSIGRRDHVKKAYVALKPGQELNFSGEGA